MATIFGTIDGNEIIGSGNIVCHPSQSIFLLPFSDDPNYKIKLSYVQAEVDEKRLTVKTINRDGYFEIEMYRSWFGESSAIVRDVLIAIDGGSNVYLNLIITVIGLKDNFAINYAYTLHSKRADH